MSASTPKSTPTSAFANPQPPPRPVIVLLAHTDLVNRFRRVPLLAHEDLVSRVRLLTPARHHPYTRQQTSPLSSSQESSEDEDESSSGTSSYPIRRPSSSTPALGPTLEQSHRIRIVRPKGAGRQSLRDLLKWDGQRLDAVKKRLRHYVEEYLKKSECFTDQDQDQVKRVKEQMVAEFPFLDEYESVWPLDQLLIAQLKYSSAASKSSATHKAIEDVRNKVVPTARQAKRR